MKDLVVNKFGTYKVANDSALLWLL